MSYIWREKDTGSIHAAFPNTTKGERLDFLFFVLIMIAYLWVAITIIRVFMDPDQKEENDNH